jgi:hypothetical protein
MAKNNTLKYLGYAAALGAAYYIYKKGAGMNGIGARPKYNEVYDYILDNIETEGYDVKATTHKEKLEFLARTFRSEAGWNVQRIGLQKALEEWLMGLPSSLHIAFSNYDIINLAKEWGSLSQNATEKQEDKIINNYWRFMAANILKLMRKYKVSI